MSYTFKYLHCRYKNNKTLQNRTIHYKTMQIFECITQTHNMKTNNKIGKNNKAKKTIAYYITLIPLIATL